MKTDALKKRMTVILLLSGFLLMLMPGNVLALVSVQVRFPILATGADCSAELLDQDGNRIQALLLKDGIEDAFTVSCYLMQDYYYTIRLIEKDTQTIKYDHTEYTVLITLFYKEDGQIGYIYTVSDGSTTFKTDRFEFRNKMIEPTPTPEPYPYCFTFTKLWQGSHEDSIDWILYRADGSVLHKKFNKRSISENEWYYEAWFSEPVDDCYLIETIPDGYKVRYENVGAHAGETDRCYNGGTIINYKVPKTGDDNHLWLWLGCVLLGVSAVCGTLIFSRKKNTHQ